MTTSFHSSVMWSPPYKTALFLGISGKIYTFFSAKESFWSAPWGDHGDMSFTRNPLDQGRSFFCKRRILCVPSIQKKQNIWPIYHLLITYIIYDYIYISPMNHQSWSIKNWCFWQPLISCKMPPPLRTRIKRKTLSTRTPLPKRSALMPEALGGLFAGLRWDISMGISGTDLLEVPTTFLRPLFQAYVREYQLFLPIWDMRSWV